MTKVNGRVIRHGYKVCRKVGGKFYSVEIYHPSAEIEYVPLKAVTPKPDSGPLTFFQTKRDARMYMNHVRAEHPDWSYTICRCLYVKASPIKLKGVWHYANKELIFKRYSDLPNGTMLALSITLIPVKRPKPANNYEKRKNKQNTLDFSRWLYLTYCEKRNLAKQNKQKYLMSQFLQFLREQGIYRSRQSIYTHFRKYCQKRKELDG